MKGDWIVLVALACFGKFLRDLTLGITQNHAGLTFAFRLRLHGHRVLQTRGNQNILHLHGNDVDAPRFGSLIDDLLEQRAYLVAAFQHVRKHGFANHITQGGLGRPTDGALIVGHVQGRFLRIQHFPKQHGVHIHRHGVFGQGFFRLETGCDDAGVYPVRNRINDRDDKK